jgi:VWFA-related protein
MIGRSGLVAAYVVAAIAIGGAQQVPPDTGTTFRSGVDVVRLDVSVLDQNRLPIRGLTAADFTVLEDGRPQPIIAFDAVDLPDHWSARASWMRDVAPDVVSNRFNAQRVVVILLDDFGVPFDPSAVQFSKNIARAAIDQLGPADLAAVVYTLTRSKGQEFTTDRTRLIAAVDRFSSSAAHGGESSRFSASAPNPSAPSASARSGLSGACLGGCLTMALRNAAEILRAWPGARKTLVLISPAARRTSPASLEAASETSDLMRTFAAMQEANLNVYQYDPRGLQVARPVDDDFGMFAESTGGRAITGTNAPWELVPQMFRENSSYYVLGFRSINLATDGRFRRVTVKVTRPAVEVRTRSGYYAPRPARTVKQPKMLPSALDRALAGGLPAGDLPISLTAAPFAASGLKGVRTRNSAALVVVAGVERAGRGAAAEVVDVVATAFRSDWKPAGRATQQVELVSRPAGESAHYDLASRLDLAPGRYEVRVAVSSPATGRTGSAYLSVTIPDFAKDPLALSGVVVENREAAGRASVTPIATLLPVVPTSVREFTGTDRLTAFVRSFQGGKSPLASVRITARIVSEEDHAVFEEHSTIPAGSFSAVRSADYRLALPLARLAPGEYLLSIAAVVDQRTSRRDVRIAIK